MEESLKKIYKEALEYRDTAPNNTRRQRKAYNDKLLYYMKWLNEVETEMEKAGYTREQIANTLKAIRKQHEREKFLA